jgi:hypothetical protein
MGDGCECPASPGGCPCPAPWGQVENGTIGPQFIRQRLAESERPHVLPRHIPPKNASRHDEDRDTSQARKKSRVMSLSADRNVQPANL